VTNPSGIRTRLLAGMLAGGLVVWPARAESEKSAQPPLATTAPNAAATKGTTTSQTRKSSPYKPVKVTYRAKSRYLAAWGIDKLRVSRTASGNLIRFSFRIVEPTQATLLLDRKATPYLVGQKSRAMLSIPVMEKIGPLRQSGAPKAGQEYWMTFSNKGNPIKPGDRVNVMIGQFHADGLVVE